MMDDRIVLSLLVDNTAGVLSRVAGMFSRRGYNIDSITAGVTAAKPTLCFVPMVSEALLSFPDSLFTLLVICMLMISIGERLIA